ncbi:MAG TPA: translocation/assembly module TamB domain-containing protein [Woeseiaceae bacterium]|nr:translocation/assembly module TamB domain-containing protein [Woeseiaceae bacterium]
MRRIGKWLKWSVVFIVALSVVLFAIAALVLNTESGTRWVLNRISGVIPGEIVAGEFTGTLWNGLYFPSVSYVDDSQRIDATEFRVSVNWPLLAAGRIPLEAVSAASFMRTSLNPAPESPEPLEVAMSPLPLSISIASGSIGRFDLNNATSSFYLEGISFGRARLTGSTIRVASLKASRDAIDASVSEFSMTLSGNVPITAQLRWVFEGGRLSGDGKVAGSLAGLTFDQVIQGEYASTASGTIRLLNRVEPEVEARVNWERWAFGTTVLLDGEIDASGMIESYDTEYRATVIVADLEPFVVSGTASGNTRELTSYSADVVAAVGNANAKGQLTWSPAFATTALVMASEINPAELRDELSGRFDATAEISVDDAGVVSVQNLIAAGVLNDALLNASGDLLIAADEQRCTGCLLSVGKNKLRIDGGLAKNALALTYSLNAPTLTELWPDLVGTAVGSGKLTGTVEQPGIVTSIELRDFAYQGTGIGALVLQAEGSGEKLDVTADWVYETLTVSAQGTVSYQEETLAGSIRRATVREQHAGEWSLEQALMFSLAKDAINVEQHNWTGANGDVSVDTFTMQGEDIRLKASLEKMPLQVAARFLPNNFELLGTATADVDISRTAGQWSGPMRWRQVGTVLRVSEFNDEFTDVTIPRAEVDAVLSNGGVKAKAVLAIEPGVLGELDFQLDALAADAPLNASLKLQGDDWSWVSAVVPQTDRFGGAISAAVNASGPLNAPEFSGNLEWKDGSLTVPALNVPIRDINVVVAGASNGDATITGAAKAGDGTLALSGEFENVMQASRSVKLKVTGLGAELVNWPEYHIWGSPDLELVGSADGWRFGGDLTVPKAEIAVREVPVGAVTVSPDVVVIGEDAGEQRATRITGEARLVLGDGVQFAAFGLDTRLTGSLTMKMVQDRPLTAAGRVTLVDGTFVAQGQKLKIDRGRLTFTGPLDDPIVDVRAERTIETLDGTVVAGIHLRGRAQNLTSTVYSTPTMSDADALSYLVIGRPLSQATQTEGGELSGAAVALGLRQATRITDQIGHSLGLDELAIAGDGGDSTALVAGKQINSNLYARYAYGVFSRLGTLLLRYRLSRSLTLEAGAGENQSIDVLYSIER